MTAATPVRVVVTTDPELDDLNSMLRLLLYSNEIDLVGLVLSSSQFHHAGDAERGLGAHRWPPAGTRNHIDQAIDAYEAVHQNLVVHDPSYPDPARLRSLVREGNVAGVGDTEFPTPGSDLIADLLLDDEPGVLVLQAWGGLNTIARALMTVEERIAGDPDAAAIRARVSAGTVLTSWGEQDDAFSSSIRPTWPELELRQVATVVWGYATRLATTEASRRFFSAEWTRRNVSSVGPIGAAYRVWGDGLQMADGFDPHDYFGLTGLDEGELRALGYDVFFAVQPAGSFISEGDSSNFALLVDNGLRNFEHPGNGGWGGSQVQDPSDPHTWISADFAGIDPFDPSPPDWGDVARWVPAFQNDVAGRLRWSVTDRLELANHHPALELLTSPTVAATAGERVRIEWATSDPDGDAVSVDAWAYEGAGTCPHPTTIERVAEGRSRCACPTGRRRGRASTSSSRRPTTVIHRSPRTPGW